MQIFGLGLPELIVIALIVLLFFGKDRLPGLFRSIGGSIRELKDGLQNGPDESTPKSDTSTSVTTHDQPASDKR